MRPALLFLLYGGDAFLICGGLTIVIGFAELLGLTARSRAASRVANATLLSAVAVGAFTATPVHPALAVALVGSCLGLALTNEGALRIRRGLGGVVAALSLLASVHEASHLYRRPTPRSSPAHIAVLGDSLTSGGFGESQRWIDVVGQQCGTRIADLSSPSATTHDALTTQLQDLPASATCVIVELGGNDMLEDRSAKDFKRDLGAILEGARRRSRTVVLLEFPALPGRWSYAAAQRRQAHQYGAIVIPKRELAAVLTSPENTFDGLHLTDRGHGELGRRVAKYVCRR